ncbi:MAG: hypothetical protein AB7T14_02875, partial [Candidatus Methylacidiphilaceae bacterium]
SEEMLDLSAAVSLSFSFRRGRAFPRIEETTHDQAEKILAGWRVRLPIPGPALPIRRRPEELSLPMIESVRDAIRAKRTLPLNALLQRLPRQVGREQAISAAAILSEIQVRAGPALEPLFCWQPA